MSFRANRVAGKDNIAENKYDGLSIGVHFINFLINKGQRGNRWYP
jgi:hypothetical protein